MLNLPFIYNGGWGVNSCKASHLNNRRGAAMLVNMIIVALVMGLMATSFAQLSSGQFASADAYRTSYQAQQLVEAKANEIAVTSYSALAGEARAAVTGATEWQREVILGAETDLGGGNMQRPVTVSVYKDAETVARASVVKYPTSAGTASGVPSGMVAYFQQTSCPAGWIAANGASGTVDVRGAFIRGLDNGRHLDPDWATRALGSYQTDAGRNITGGFGTVRTAYIYASTGAFAASTTDWHDGGAGGNPGYYYTFDASRVWGATHTSTEFRPANVALLGCIKQ